MPIWRKFVYMYFAAVVEQESSFGRRESETWETVFFFHYCRFDHNRLKYDYNRLKYRPAAMMPGKSGK